MTTPQDPYGQGQPNMPPAAPPLDESELRGAQNLPAPPPVQVSFWLWVGSAVVSVIGALLGFTQSGAALDAARSNNTAHLTDAQLQTAVTFGLVLAAVFLIVFAGLYLLFAFKARAGRNWARIVLTVLTVVGVLFLALSFSLVSGLTTLVAVVATVLLFLPASNQFYAASKRVAR